VGHAGTDRIITERFTQVGLSVFLAAGVLALIGCTTVLYKGPRRPRREVATIRTSDTTITAIDGKRVDPMLRGQKFEVLPGPHSISLKVDASRRGFMSTTVIVSRGSLTVCFVAKPGIEYLTRPSTDDDETWTPMIVDTSIAYPIKVFEVEGPGVDCRERISAP
jgi:hypothetical protein